MGRGGAIYLSYTALVLLSAVSRTSAGLWDVDIDLDPAPSPKNGPPFSAHATRNLSLLPYQIIGIVASYLGTILIVGTLLLTVGRRLRKKAQNTVEKPIEMVKPMARAFEASPSTSLHGPFSEHNGHGVFSLRKKKSDAGSMRSTSTHVNSPVLRSAASFDPAVIEQNRQRDQDEMSRLYGAVYQFEERNFPQAVEGAQIEPAAPPQYSRPNRPTLTISQTHLQPTQPAYPQSPYSPTVPQSPSVRAIYPPSSNRYPADPSMAGNANVQASPGLEQTYSPTRNARASSFGSHRTADTSLGPSSNKLRKSILKKSFKNLVISGPVHLQYDNVDDARTPLSPRFYEEPGIPPDLPTSRTSESQYSPTTPGTGRSFPYPRTHEDDEEDEELDRVRDLPQMNPQRAPDYDNTAQLITDYASTRPDPTGTTPQNKRANRPAPTLNTLPFRQYQQPTTQQSHFPMSPTSWYPQSAGPVKTTFVDAPGRRLGGPLTGVPTPYSPYMPRDFVTPVTPRLTTKFERKQLKKEQRTIQSVIAEEDRVANDEDLWGTGD